MDCANCIFGRTTNGPSAIKITHNNGNQTFMLQTGKQNTLCLCPNPINMTLNPDTGEMDCSQFKPQKGNQVCQNL